MSQLKPTDVRHADFNNPQTSSEAFEGADRLLLISTDDLFSGKPSSQFNREASRRQGQ
jgi:hypothetical protein